MKEISDGSRKLLRVLCEDRPHDGDERGYGNSKVMKHTSSESGRVAGEALLFIDLEAE